MMIHISVATKLRRFLSGDPSLSSSLVHFQKPKNLRSFEDFRPKIAKILWENILAHVYLNTTVTLATIPFHSYWEEIIRITTTWKFHRSTFVVLINYSVLPEKLLSSCVVCVIAVTFGYVWSSASMRQWNGNGHII